MAYAAAPKQMLYISCRTIARFDDPRQSFCAGWWRLDCGRIVRGRHLHPQGYTLYSFRAKVRKSRGRPFSGISIVLEGG